MAEIECCYSCEYYKDALCVISDNYDDENPCIFKCELYEETQDE